MCPKPPPYIKLPENGRGYAVFTDEFCHMIGNHWRWKAAVWGPTQWVTEAAEGKGESSQFAEMKAIQPALEIAEWEKWPELYVDWWLMPYWDGCSSGKKPTGNAEVNPSGLLNCGKTSLHVWKTWLWRYLIWMPKRQLLNFFLIMCAVCRQEITFCSYLKHLRNWQTKNPRCHELHYAENMYRYTAILFWIFKGLFLSSLSL